MATIADDLLFVFLSYTVIIATWSPVDGILCCSTDIDRNWQSIAKSNISEEHKSKPIRIEFTTEPKMSSKLLACEFEVFGVVQGVFFRKYTQKQATGLGLRGWCMNTQDGSVKGQLEGEEKPFNEMKYWLQTKGSPSSRIDKAVFSVPKEISSYSFKDFSIRR